MPPKTEGKQAQSPIQGTGDQPKRKALIYACVSSSYSTDGLPPLEEQVAACREVAEIINADVVGVFQDGVDQPVTGKKRPQLESAFDALEAGETKFLIVVSGSVLQIVLRTPPLKKRLNSLGAKGVNILICSEPESYNRVNSLQTLTLRKG